MRVPEPQSWRDGRFLSVERNGIRLLLGVLSCSPRGAHPIAMPNPFDAKAKKNLTVNGKEYSYYSLPALGDARLSTLRSPHTVTLLKN